MKIKKLTGQVSGEAKYRASFQRMEKDALYYIYGYDSLCDVIFRSF